MTLGSFFTRSRLDRCLVACALLGSLPCTTLAQGANAPAEPMPMAEPATVPVEAAPRTAPPPPPYSIPWQLRPTAAATVLRSDTAFAFYESPAEKGGFTLASMLLGSYKLTPEFAPLVRLGVVSNSPPDGTATASGAALESKASFLNPVVGGTYLFNLSPDFKLAAFLGLTIPVGSGGGDKPDPSVVAANGAGIVTRSAMDNAMFAVDYFTIFPGVGLAYVAHGVTVQVEATLLQLMRVRGEGTPPGADSSKTNFTAGLHVGYFFIPQLSAGIELRHQRWLSTPASVKLASATRDTTTAAVGLRVHIKLSDTTWLRPGIAYARALDDPMDAANYNIVQLDIPISF
jgi:hypothetical protein